jgi:hypothetical protein
VNNEPCEFLPVKDWNEKPEPRFQGQFLLGMLIGIAIATLFAFLATMLLLM